MLFKALAKLQSCSANFLNSTQFLKSRNIIGQNHCNFQNNLTPKTLHLINLFAVSIFSNNQVQANTLMSTLNNFFENNGGMLYPVPYLNLLIYYYLKNGKIKKKETLLMEF